MATPKRRPKAPRPLPPTALARSPGPDAGAGATGAPRLASVDEALELIFAPIARGEGFRHGALGGTGSGKTWGIRCVLYAAVTNGAADLVVSHDVKGPETEFPEGTMLRSIADFTPERFEDIDRTRHVVFRGDPLLDDEELPPEPVARAARKVLRKGIPVCFNAGELDTCLTDGGRSWTAPTVRWFSTQARRLRGSMTWTTQQPKRLPDEIWDLSSSIALHNHEVRSVNYLEGLGLEAEMIALLPRLARGEFVLWIPGRNWNRCVYRFPAPPAGGGGRELAVAA